MSKRILMTGGGSAGHVTPNIALIPRLRAAGFEVHYAGRGEGIERDLIQRLGVHYHGVSAGKLRRYLDVQNATDTVRVAHGFLQSLVLVHQVRPTVLFSKGGFVSCPLVWAAWLHRVPVVIHESDITPGLANRLSAPFARRICFSFPETASAFPRSKGVLTGLPIRAELLQGSAAEGRRICGFADTTPVVLVMGGSLGAEHVNKVVWSALDRLLGTFSVCHVCGLAGVNATLESTASYRQFGYVDTELPHLLAMADVVVSRAGATALFELLAVRKPSLLVPLPERVSRGDQILNAESFEKQGFCRALRDEQLTPESLVAGVRQVYAERSAMVAAMSAVASANSVDRVVQAIESCVTGS
jgi:UDP-N-acetylglucosamine--N-acetylmuramyl-(pentapeptide) pyrophosphoryl-undecaprenol N-acetylglucosamine transferase